MGQGAPASQGARVTGTAHPTRPVPSPPTLLPNGAALWSLPTDLHLQLFVPGSCCMAHPQQTPPPPRQVGPGVGRRASVPPRLDRGSCAFDRSPPRVASPPSLAPTTGGDGDSGGPGAAEPIPLRRDGRVQNILTQLPAHLPLPRQRSRPHPPPPSRPASQLAAPSQTRVT